MSAGISITKNEIDQAISAIGQDMHMVMIRSVEFKYWLDGIPDGDLTTLGYTAGDIANLRTAVADCKQISDIFNGLANLSVAKDFRTFLRRVWGFGFDRWN